MKRAEILENAKKCVCGQREKEYGKPENNFNLIAKLWGVYTDTSYTAKDVAMMLALLKVARIKSGVKANSFIDLAGYAACAGEIAENEEKKKLHFDAKCLLCGESVPEGSLICPMCNEKFSK